MQANKPVLENKTNTCSSKMSMQFILVIHFNMRPIYRTDYIFCYSGQENRFSCMYFNIIKIQNFILISHETWKKSLYPKYLSVLSQLDVLWHVETCREDIHVKRYNILPIQTQHQHNNVSSINSTNTSNNRAIAFKRTTVAVFVWFSIVYWPYITPRFRCYFRRTVNTNLIFFSN